MIIAAAEQMARITDSHRDDRMTPREIAVEVLDAAYVDRIVTEKTVWPPQRAHPEDLTAARKE